MRKITSLFIILALVVSLFTFCVSAEETLPAANVTEEDIALSTKLETLGVITNEFDLKGYATRGDMAQIVADYISVPESNTKSFKDVSSDHPHYGAIGALYNLGVITGDENGNFNPDEYVTYDEALVYIINAIGHKPFASREGGYPTGYHRVAIRHDMLSAISMQKGTDKATVSDIYKMLEKALTAATVETSYYGDDSITYILSETETFLSTTYKIRKFRGIVTGTDATKLTTASTNVKTEQIEIDGKVYDVSGYENANLLGRFVEFYINTEDKDVILYIEEAPKYNETVRIDADDILRPKTTDTRIYYSDADDKEYHIDFKSTIDVIYNEQCYSSYGVLSAILPTSGFVEALDNNRDGSYDVLFIYDYKSIVVNTIDSYNQTVTGRNPGEDYNLSTDGGRNVSIRFINQTRNISFESIKIGDILSIAQSKLAPTVTTVYVSREVVTGKIEGYESDRGYLINGEWYETVSGLTLSLGDAGDFYLDMNNDIVHYEAGAADADAKLAVMAGLDYELGNFTNRLTIKLFTEDEEFIDADLKENVKINGTRYDLSERTDVDTVLSSIGTRSGDRYVVNSAYVVVYKLDANGQISYLDLGGIGSEGHLNTIVSAGTSMLVRPNFIMVYADESGNTVRTRYNSSGKVFYAPADGNLSELKEYGIYKDFKVNNYYQTAPTNYTSLDSYAVYTFNESTIPTADVILFRSVGAQGVVGAESGLAVITDVSTAIDSEEQQTVKIYFGQTSYTVKSELTWSKNGATNRVPVSTISSQLTEGTAVQYATDNKGEIASIKVIAEYNANSTGNVLTPAFRDANTFIQDSYDGDQDERNLIVGKVVENDSKTNQLIFTTNGTDRYLLYTSGTNVSIYRGARKIVTDATVSDLVPGDEFVCRTTLYYVPKDMIVYR